VETSELGEEKEGERKTKTRRSGRRKRERVTGENKDRVHKEILVGNHT
jgi:hypothetical protein